MGNCARQLKAMSKVHMKGQKKNYFIKSDTGKQQHNWNWRWWGQAGQSQTVAPTSEMLT